MIGWMDSSPNFGEPNHSIRWDLYILRPPHINKENADLCCGDLSHNYRSPEWGLYPIHLLSYIARGHAQSNTRLSSNPFNVPRPHGNTAAGKVRFIPPLRGRVLSSFRLRVGLYRLRLAWFWWEEGLSAPDTGLRLRETNSYSHASTRMSGLLVSPRHQSARIRHTLSRIHGERGCTPTEAARPPSRPASELWKSARSERILVENE